MPISRYSMFESSSETIIGKLLYVTYSKYENDWPSLLHTHPHTEMFYVIAGNGFFCMEDKEYPLHKDDFVIINPNTAHTERSNGDVPLEYVLLGIQDMTFSFEGGRQHIIFSCSNAQKDLLFYMNTMLHELEAPAPDSDRICQNLLEVMIIKLIRRTNFAFEITPAIKINTECLKLKRYIEANYTKEITLDFLSELSHLNKYYLVHVFNKYYGCSPINYLCRVRIEASKALLSGTDYSITEVAQSSGFSSQSYFAQCFLKSCGMTASAYRKLCQKEANHIS